MLLLHKLEWSNFFSYGPDNEIQLDDSPLTQILGTNGKGKSSIPLILEEIMFGKNSKGFKKTEIPNRFIKNPTLWGRITFSIDNISYELELARKSTLKLVLKKDGEDISFHTTTNTYKHIEELLGMDFKSFTQLVYQSATSSLQFLTATDTNRKKFLISLFNLGEYLQYHEKFKLITKGLKTEVDISSGKVQILETRISKLLNQEVDKKPIQEAPELDRDLEDRVPEIKAKLISLVSENKAINNNEQYKTLRNAIDGNLISSAEESMDVSKTLDKDYFMLGGEIKYKRTNIHSMKTLGIGECPTCKQEVDKKYVDNMLAVLEPELADLVAKESTIRETRDKLARLQKRNKQIKNAKEEFERLTNLINNELPSTVYDPNVLKAELLDINTKITKLKNLIADIKATNSKAEKHNMATELRDKELKEAEATLNDILVTNKSLNKQLNNAEILKNAFGTNGLVSFKLEYLVKDLESQINHYLAELSDGRFQLQFKLSNEKLNVEIVDNAIIVSISALSAGELARVNIATLLAIRKLMGVISASRINVLFLDEVMGVLDAEGKDLLTELLLKEDKLNTFLVSHEYSHPLIPTITIIKEDNISGVQHG